MRSRVLRGVSWKAASQVVLQASHTIVAIILARLLTPHDFGLAGMVLVFSGLVFLFTDLALGAALIQRRTLSEQDRSTVFWTSFAAGVVFFAAGVAVSGPIADFYGEPAVQPLFAALSLTFVIHALATTQTALLNREMNFRSLELRVMGATTVGAAVGVTAAVAGAGAWAIIAQRIASASVGTTLLWTFSPWRPRFTYSLASLRRLGGFSANVFATRFLFYLNRNADNLLIGRFLGAAALGAYSLAYHVMLMPFTRIATPIQDVLFPAFSRMQDDPDRMGQAWVRVNRFVSAISIPALLGMIVVAPDFVAVVLGDKWSAATPVIQILAWVGLLQSLQRMNSSILQARDRAGTLLAFAVIAFVFSIGAFAVGLRWGIVGVAACYAFVNTFMQPFYTWLTARTLGMSVWTVVRSLWGVVQASLIMVAAVLVTRLGLLSSDVPAAGRLVVCVAVGALVFLACSAWRAPELRGDLRLLVGRKRAAVADSAPGR
jgi:O-antigen/teichoic acid export membrane protein